MYKRQVEGVPSEEIASFLGANGVAVRAGLHCAPAAHRFMGTLELSLIHI